MTETIQAIAERSTDGVFVCNPRTLKLTYVNDRFASFFKTSKEQLLNKPGLLLSLLCTEEIGYLQKIHTELLTTGSISDAEFCFCIPGEESRYFRCDAFATDNEATGFVKDISAEKETEAHYINHVSRAAFLLDRFEEMGHISTRKIAATKSRFDLLRLLTIFREELTGLYPNHSFRIMAHQPSLHINIDSISFLQLLQHLLAIATHLAPEQEEIRIITDSNSSGRFTVGIKSNAGEIPSSFDGWLSSGSHFRNGIDAPELKDLYAVKVLASQLKGATNFTQDNGGGFCFCVSLPRE